MTPDMKSKPAKCPNCGATVTITFEDCIESPPKKWEFVCPDCGFPLHMELGGIELEI